MSRERSEADDCRIVEELVRLGDDAPTPSEESLRALARTAASATRELGRPPARMRRRPSMGWTVLPVAIALLVGSGLGFGLASSATPEGTAGTAFTGFGFLPARGWTVVQSGTSDASGKTHALAANVSIHLADGLRRVTEQTVESLPHRAVLVHATFSTRGDPEEDSGFADRELPLQLSDATRPASGGPDPYRLRAAVRGYNVDVRVYYGTDPPSAQMVAAAQRQLGRLILASDPVTIVAHPVVVLNNERVRLFGSVESRAAGELVDIQAKDCGQRFFRGVAGTTTVSGGSWSIEYLPKITTTLRAVWRGRASAQVTVRQRPWVGLRTQSRGKFRVTAAGGDIAAWFVRKRVLIQQRGPSGWRTIKEVVLTENSLRGTAFNLTVPRGSLLRAVLPLSQARPCYLAGISRTLRT